MTVESVRRFFAERAPEIEVIETEESSATVAEAAAAHGVAPERIAKTICVRAGDRLVLVVAAGTARLDNRKFKDRFAAKPKMPDGAEVMAVTGHPVGGVCPFGLPAPMEVCLDESLRPFDEVVPAAGGPNAAVRLSPQRLAELTGGEWADLCKGPAG